MYRAITCMMILPLCLGQMCATPVPAAPRSGIPQGVYTGDATQVVTLEFSADDISPMTRQSVVSTSRSFGPDGILEATSGGPVKVGYVFNMDTDAAQFMTTITRIDADDNNLVITLEAEAEMDLPTFGHVSFQGTGQDIYTYQPSGQVSYTRELSLISGVVLDGVFTMQLQSQGMLAL